MTKYIEPIYDRDSADLAAKNSKAYFNIADWERIDGNTSILKVIVDYFMGTSISLETLTPPDIYTIPTKDDINAMAGNIEAIRETAGLPEGIIEPLKTDWEEGSGVDSPDYETINAWERTIALIISKIEAAVSYYMYCGVPTVGMARFYQNRWRVFVTGIPDSPTPVRVARTNVAYAGVELTRNNGFRRYA